MVSIVAHTKKRGNCTIAYPTTPGLRIANQKEDKQCRSPRRYVSYNSISPSSTMKYIDVHIPHASTIALSPLFDLKVAKFGVIEDKTSSKRLSYMSVLSNYLLLSENGANV